MSIILQIKNLKIKNDFKSVIENFKFKNWDSKISLLGV